MTTATGIVRPRSLLAPLHALWRRVAGFGRLLAVAQQAAVDADRLYTLSDAELADIGLTRQEIPAMLVRRHFS